jgi:DNA primase
VATDADIAGRVAAERDFWILAAHRLDPLYAQLPEGCDPADLLARHGPAALVAALDQAMPLGEQLLHERLTNLPPDQALREAARVVAARAPASWDEGSRTIGSRLNVPHQVVRQTLLAQVKDWNTNPRQVATRHLQVVNDVKRRLTDVAQIPPEQQWAVLADQLDQRLLRQGDWPALAQLIQQVYDQGHDAAAITRKLITATPLNDLPAQDLRYRLVAHLGLSVDPHPPPVDTPTAKTTARPEPRRRVPATTPTPPR